MSSLIRPLLLASGAAALLSGCAAVGPDFTAPKAPAVAGYAAPGETVPAGVQVGPSAPGAADWWRVLGSPALDQVMRQALADSPSVAEVDATLDQARQEAASAGGQRGLQGDLAASASRDRINLTSFGITLFPSPTVNQYSIGANVVYDLDLFGGLKRQAESADARAEAARDRAGAAYLTLTGQIAIQAARIAALRAQIAAVQAALADDQTNLEMVRKAQDAGGAAPSAQVGARAQIAADQALAPPLRQSLAEARHALAILAGRSPAGFTAPDFDLAAMTVPAELPVELPSTLVRQRPDILAAEADLHAATAQIGVQAAKLYPDIKLNAGYTQTSLSPGQLFNYAASGWNIGPGLTLPLFDRQGLKADQKAAEAAARVSLARYQTTVLQAFGQVADALQALTNDEAALTADADAQAQAQANLDDARFAFAHGGGALLDTVTAQRRLDMARRDYAAAQGRHLTDVIRITLAAGADWRGALTWSKS